MVQWGGQPTQEQQLFVIAPDIVPADRRSPAGNPVAAEAGNDDANPDGDTGSGNPLFTHAPCEQ